MRIVSPRGLRAANDAGPAFAHVTNAERRAADLFFADLFVARPARRARAHADDCDLFWRDLLGLRT